MEKSNTDATSVFPQRLTTARKQRKLSQSELAEKTGLQPSWISHFETGSRKPSFDNLRRLADALLVTTDYLLGRVDDIAALGKPDELHRHLSQMTSRDREIAEDFLQILAQKSADKERPGKK